MYHLRDLEGDSNMLGRCPLSNQRSCRATKPPPLEYCKIKGTDTTLIIEFGPKIMQFTMDQLISGASAKVRRQIAVHGDRCLEESELPFVFNTEFLVLQATHTLKKCITWGVLDSAIDGIRQCGYDQGKYNLMACIITGVWSGEVGYIILKRLV